MTQYKAAIVNPIITALNNSEFSTLDVWELIDAVKATNPRITALSIKLAVDQLERDGMIAWDGSFEGDKLYALPATATH